MVNFFGAEVNSTGFIQINGFKSKLRSCYCDSINKICDVDCGMISANRLVDKTQSCSVIKSIFLITEHSMLE